MHTLLLCLLSLDPLYLAALKRAVGSLNGRNLRAPIMNRARRLSSIPHAVQEVSNHRFQERLGYGK
jgi:hypothetical protein